jgi:di/tricarboxylate transporter
LDAEFRCGQIPEEPSFGFRQGVRVTHGPQSRWQSCPPPAKWRREPWVVLVVLAALVALFATEKLRVDIVALLGLAALMVSGILAPKRLLPGSAAPTIVMLGAVFVIGGALQESGCWTRQASGWFAGCPREFWLVLGLMLVSALLSAFMNNTSVTAMMVPLVMSLARRTRVSPQGS